MNRTILLLVFISFTCAMSFGAINDQRPAGQTSYGSLLGVPACEFFHQSATIVNAKCFVPKRTGFYSITYFGLVTKSAEATGPAKISLVRFGGVPINFDQHSSDGLTISGRGTIFARHGIPVTFYLDYTAPSVGSMEYELYIFAKRLK